MLRTVNLYFEDAYPNITKRWYAEVQEDYCNHTAVGETAEEALKILGDYLLKARNDKRVKR